MFALVCDPMGPVVDTALRELVPALLAWKKREKQSLSQLYKGLLSRFLMAAQVNHSFILDCHCAYDYVVFKTYARELWKPRLISMLPLFSIEVIEYFFLRSARGVEV